MWALWCDYFGVWKILLAGLFGWSGLSGCSGWFGFLGWSCYDFIVDLHWFRYMLRMGGPEMEGTLRGPSGPKNETKTFSYQWNLCQLRKTGWCWSRTAATTATEQQKQQLSHPHFFSPTYFLLYPTFSIFSTFLARVRLIFTPRSRAPLTHSPILVLTPSFGPDLKSWKY